jgi:hypothetical protein
LIHESSFRKDYGVDLQCELLSSSAGMKIRVLNIIFNIQLKSTEKRLDEDGGVQKRIKISNINYLFNTPHSLFVVYHITTDTFFYEFVDDVMKRISESHKTSQKTCNVRFSKKLDGCGSFTTTLSNSFWRMLANPFNEILLI